MYTAWLFPAFISEYIGSENEIFDSLNSDFDELLKKGAEAADKDLDQYNIRNNNFLGHELRNQYISYIFACSVSNLLKQSGLKPKYLSGLSMGLYAALFSGGSLLFEEGLLCIKKAFNLSVSGLSGMKFGMAAIIGLTGEELSKIISSTGMKVEIVNINGPYSFVISGRFSEIEEVAGVAQKEGAFHTGLLDVSCPYHSRFMKNVAGEFRNYLEKCAIKTLETPLISTIDQSMVQSREQIIAEMTRNLDTRISWYDTMKKMIDLKATTFIECGAGKNLYKIGKFIDGSFSIIPVNKLPVYLRDRH